MIEGEGEAVQAAEMTMRMKMRVGGKRANTRFPSQKRTEEVVIISCIALGNPWEAFYGLFWSFSSRNQSALLVLYKRLIFTTKSVKGRSRLLRLGPRYIDVLREHACLPKERLDSKTPCSVPYCLF